MMTRLDSNSLDSKGNLLGPLHRIRIVLGLSFLAACAFSWFNYLGDKQWHYQHPGDSGAFVIPLWMTAVRIALVLAPFVLCAVLLSTRNEHSQAAGAGIAVVLFSSGLFVGVAALLGLFFRFYPDPYAGQDLAAVLTFLACSVWIVVSAFRIGKVSSGVFFLTLVVTATCLTWGKHVLDATEYTLGRQHEQQKGQAAIELYTPVVQAQHVLASLAGCLILNQSLHPQSGYPSSLDTLPPNWSCETKFAAKAVQDYSLSYIPVTDASGRVADFHLIAMPGKVVRGHYPLTVDSHGVLFSEVMWGYSSSFIRAATSEARDSEILELKRNLDSYMQHNAPGTTPDALTAEMIGESYGSQVPIIEPDGKRLETKNHVFRYLGPKPGHGSSFALSVQCQSYGQNCLRSYFLDYDGVLHATGEPREATADDPPALECESNDSVCKGVVWPVP
jgi:hypothetical protein